MTLPQSAVEALVMAFEDKAVEAWREGAAAAEADAAAKIEGLERALAADLSADSGQDLAGQAPVVIYFETPAIARGFVKMMQAFRPRLVDLVAGDEDTDRGA